jgi:hypothetical protein
MNYIVTILLLLIPISAQATIITVEHIERRLTI